MSDLVAELDRWIKFHGMAESGLVMQRARDEIVALRWAIEDREKEHTVIRAEALEDCIRACPECADRIKGIERWVSAARRLLGTGPQD